MKAIVIATNSSGIVIGICADKKATEFATTETLIGTTATIRSSHDDGFSGMIQSNNHLIRM